MTQENIHIIMRQMSLFDHEDIRDDHLKFVDAIANKPLGYKFKKEHVDLMKMIYNKYRPIIKGKEIEL